MRKIISAILVLCIGLCMTACKKNEGNVSGEESVKIANETLKVCCYSHKDLNPLTAVNNENMQMERLIFESLTECDNTQKSKPLLAESYSVSDDGMVWTVKLKNNVKWHDGTILTSKDVVYTYNYVMDNAAETAYSVNVSNIEYVTAISDYEVNFKLKSPQANFVNLLEIPVVKKQDSSKFNPVGTGPYVYKKTDNKIVYLEANQNWHGGEVKIKNVQARILPDKETVTYAYVSKEIDVVSVGSGTDMGKYSSNADNTIVDYPSNTFNFISINTAAEPLSNRMFRKAIAHAIDKETINSTVLLSHGSVANSCINTNWWVYNPSVTIYEYSKDKASEAFDVAKKNVVITPVTLMVNKENEDKCKTAEMIKENLHSCGIIMNIEYVDWDTFIQRVDSGNYQMYLGSLKYAADINPQYVIKNPSPELQSLFMSLQTQTTEDGIMGKYFEIQEKIAVELQIIPLTFDVSAVMYNKRMEGKLTPDRINIFNGIKNMSLKQ